ncbi:MAG: glycosyltransferase family 4 protein, partial [Bacteroidales bacterium]|nr:glycosyltransferase family 4 protein [Bacteroidales bacterium]
MKIGIEGQRLFRQKKHGMDMVALELIRNLQKIDKENEYFIFVKPDQDTSCLEQSENFKIIELGGGPYPTWEQFALPRAAAKVGCDVLHCTSNTAPIWSKVPLIVTLHDIIYMESLNLFKGSATWYQKFGNLYRKLVVPKILKKSKKVITVSHFEKNRIREFFGFPESDKRLVAVYNGVSEHFLPVTNQEELQRVKLKYKLPDEFFFFLGNTDPKKNTKGVLTAYNQFLKEFERPIPLVMLDYDRVELRKLLNDIGAPELEKNIHLTGYVINTDLPAIYNLCNIFLYPSLRESFGIPMLEAMRCGVPVITSNTSSMPEVSGEAALIVDPYKPEEITEAIHKLLNDKELRNNYIELGYKNAAKYSWEA